VNTEIISLFQKYLNKQCNPQQLEIVLRIIEEGQHQAEWDAALSQDAIEVMNAEDVNLPIGNELALNLNERILYTINNSPAVIQLSNRKRILRRIAIAASVLLCSAIGLYIYEINHTKQTHQPTTYTNDILPGKQGATLTLANGKKIILSDAVNGELAKEAGVVISKTDDGQLVYDIIDNGVESSRINTLSTSNGETYKVRLPDHSEVWLNAASTLKFPASFSSSKIRKVELIGEGYFEIAKDKSKPFIVKTAQQEVEVLGTHFNINSYLEEASVKTTLIEGRIKISGKSSSRILRPGQQSTFSGKGDILLTDADVDAAIAWKNNQFMFDSENIQVIMRMIARWYNVDIEYVGEISDEKFGGGVSRFDDVSKVLKSLESTNKVHFKIEGKKILVSK
jgi:transmembrane sensor